MKNICIVNTYYSLFLSLLVIKNWKANTFFLFSNNIEIQGENVFVYQNKKYYSWKFLFYFISIIKSFFIVSYLKFFIIKKEKLTFIIQDGVIFFDLFFRKEKFICIEDGIMSYKKIEKKSRFFFNKNNNNCSTVYLLKKERGISNEFLQKNKLFYLSELWSQKTQIEKKEILSFFNISLEKLKKIKGKRYILFTQPLSEDGTISEGEKISIYIKIIKKYTTSKMVIKTHPKETTNYKKIFPNIEVIEDKFPAELFSIIGINFQKAITIFSTAALTIDKNTEVDWYGTEIHTKILERFGSMEKIMKTNAYIEEE